MKMGGAAVSPAVSACFSKEGVPAYFLRVREASAIAVAPASAAPRKLPFNCASSARLVLRVIGCRLLFSERSLRGS